MWIDFNNTEFFLCAEILFYSLGLLAHLILPATTFFLPSYWTYRFPPQLNNSKIKKLHTMTESQPGDSVLLSLWEISPRCPSVTIKLSIHDFESEMRINGQIAFLLPCFFRWRGHLKFRGSSTDTRRVSGRAETWGQLSGPWTHTYVYQLAAAGMEWKSQRRRRKGESCSIARYHFYVGGSRISSPADRKSVV